MSADVLGTQIITPRLKRFIDSVKSGVYEELTRREGKPSRQNTLRTNINGVIKFSEHLSNDKGEKSWEMKTLREFERRRERVWNPRISKEEGKAKEVKLRDDAREEVELCEGDFGSYINSSIRRDAASLYAKDKPTVKECITFRNFLMTKAAMCNSNRSGIWEFINVSHIKGEKTKLVNGEQQLLMPDSKTNKNLHWTVPEHIYNAMMRYIEVQ